jgi:hypothetical protein
MQSARQSARTFRDGWLPFGVGAQVAYAVESRYLCNDVLASGADPESRRTQHFLSPFRTKKSNAAQRNHALSARVIFSHLLVSRLDGWRARHEAA